jgi:gliding motility-associated lipoprotein GldD
MSRTGVLFFLVFSFFSCQNTDYSPKPKAYHRIIFPEKSYKNQSVDGCPFLFDAPSYSLFLDDTNRNAKPCWKNIDFPQFNARLHLSYFAIDKNATLDALTEDARAFVFKHTTKATSIDQQKIANPENNIHGLVYNIQGNTASNLQFFVTDQKKHYLRGALYFNEKPNLDSIQPVLDYLKSDIQHMISTIRWK